MRFHAPFSWILLAACSYDFGGADGGSSAGGASTSSTTDVTTGTGGTSPTSSTASTTASIAVVASSSTGVALPDPIPPCGGVTDDFDDFTFDETIWIRTSVDGDVREVGGYLQLQTYGGSSSVAQIELKTIPVAPCTFGFAVDHDTMTVALQSADGLLAIGLTSANGEALLIHRDDADTPTVPASGGPDGIAVVLLQERVVLLAYEDDDEPWIKIAEEPRATTNDWLTTSRALVFTRKPNELAEIDDYGVRPVHPSDL